MSETAEQLRKLREYSGKRQSDVAAEAGISLPYLSDIERGRRLNIDETLARINRVAAVYGKRFRLVLEDSRANSRAPDIHDPPLLLPDAD